MIILYRYSNSYNFSTFYSKKIDSIRQELLEIESNFVESLKNGIDNYMNVFNRKIHLKAFENLHTQIFGNILNIYDFHRNHFLPALLSCGEDDLTAIAETFTDYLYNNHFYIYVLYAIDREQNLTLCNRNIDFWNVSSSVNVIKLNYKLIDFLEMIFRRSELSAAIDLVSTRSCCCRFSNFLDMQLC